MKKILIAEDDKFLANAYRVKLERENYDVRVVFDGNEIFNVLPDFLPDLIVLDLIMPVKDGFTTLKELKEDGSYKDIPVLVASNLGQSEDIVKATKLGATDYITKTDLSMKDFAQKVKLLIGENPHD